MVKFFVLNFILSLVIFICLIIMKKKDAFIKFCIMAFFPGGGILVLLILGIYVMLDKNLKEGNVIKHLPDDIGHPELLPKAINLDTELNTIPVEDALILNDNHTKRTIIMDALKRDSHQYIGFLVKALKDSDTETSHYAATAVTEIKRKLMLSIQELEVRYEENKHDIDYLKIYADVLKKYIESGLLDDFSFTKYLNEYSMVLRSILEITNSEEFYYEEKINCDIKLRNYEEAISYLKQYRQYFNNSDNPYILLMKIYFLQRNRDALKSTIKELMQSNIKIKKESLKIIKFWLEGIKE